MKFTSGENINTVISVEKYVFNPTPPPFATAPVFIWILTPASRFRLAPA